MESTRSKICQDAKTIVHDPGLIPYQNIIDWVSKTIRATEPALVLSRSYSNPGCRLMESTWSEI